MQKKQERHSDKATRKKENRQTVTKKSIRDYRCSIVVYRGGYGEPVVRLITNEQPTNNQRITNVRPDAGID